MTDESLVRRVYGAFKETPSLDASDVSASVQQGIVTLRGYARSIEQKALAERVALDVYGLKGVANDIAVRARRFQRTDTEIAQAAAAALAGNTNVPTDRVTVCVSDGQLTLNGMVNHIVLQPPVRDLPRD